MFTLSVSTIILLLLPIASVFVNYYLNLFLALVIDIAVVVFFYFEMTNGSFLNPGSGDIFSYLTTFDFQTIVYAVATTYSAAYLVVVPFVLAVRWWA